MLSVIHSLQTHHYNNYYSILQVLLYTSSCSFIISVIGFTRALLCCILIQLSYLLLLLPIHLGLASIGTTVTMTTAMTEVWTEAQLLGVEEGSVEIPLESSKGGKKVYGKGVDTNPLLWGRPGHLTPDEVQVYMRLKNEIAKRGPGEFRDTVYALGESEGEVYALTRWCRARKYVYDDIIKMIEEATEVRKSAKDHEFYPDPIDALGVDKSLFFAQYPQLYTGFTKTGVPVFISKPGILNVDGMECITTLDGILKFHWHIMMHDYAKRLQSQKEKDPENFKKFECFCVLDLNKLTTSQLSRRALAIIKEQAAIDSVCFPETMSKMLIVNAPTYFSATWGIIKGWLDARTAAKIEVISSRSTMEKRLLEFIDADQLPKDYGGTGPDTNDSMNEGITGDFSRLETHMLYLRGHGSKVIDVLANESVQVSVFTRSLSGATFTLTDSEGTKAQLSGEVLVKHAGTDDENEIPTSTIINTEMIKGPIKLKVKADSLGSRFSTINFLLVFSFKQN